MLFEFISGTNNPKIQRRSDGKKVRFKGPGIIYAEDKKIDKWFSKMSTTATRDPALFISNSVTDHKK